MNFEDNNDLAEKFNNILEEVKGKINKSIVENEKFETLFINELNFMHFKTSSTDIDVDIALDKNYVSLICNAPLINCARNEFDGKNKNFFKTTFYIKNDNLFVEYDQGTLFDKNELEKNGFKASTTYNSKLEVNYSMRCFTKEGIEYSNSSYKDCYLMDVVYDEANLKEIVLSSFHKPIFSEYKLAKSPIHLLSANIRNTYRKLEEYAIIHTNAGKCTKEGYKDVCCLLYSAHPMFPDLLRGESRIAKTVEMDGKYVFVIENNYAENVNAGIEKAKKFFKDELEKEKDNIDENIYKKVIHYLK